MNLHVYEQIALAMLRDNVRHYTIPDVSDKCGCEPTTARFAVAMLMERGLARHKPGTDEIEATPEPTN